jgi:hypothetical protein
MIRLRGRHIAMALGAAGLVAAGCGSSTSKSPSKPAASAPAPVTSKTQGAASTPRSMTGGTTSTVGVAPGGAAHACGLVAFAPQSGYRAGQINAEGTDCATARQVAQASKPHQFDPPAPGHQPASYSSGGFTCIGRVDPSGGLAATNYRCTRGGAVVTFVRTS